jgi:O-antigen ligase
MTTTTFTALGSGRGRSDRLEGLALGSALLFVAAVQLFVAGAYILLTATVLCWLLLVGVRNERIEVPRVFWPLAVYGGLTLVSALAAPNRFETIVDCKQLVLFFIVPLVYRIARGERAFLLTNVIITIGALSAIIGIVQFGIFQYDTLDKRPAGSLTHYMTYSGLLMLVGGAVAGRLLYEKRDRTWPALVLPAVLVALSLTFTRNTWVGISAAMGALFVLKDRRLLALLPIAVALLLLVAPGRVTARVYSVLDLNDPANRDRVAMLRSGWRIVRDHPLVGVGPDNVKLVYPQYRMPEAVEPLNVHLHNVPMQIAAERGLPALAAWLWFVVVVLRDLYGRVRSQRSAGLAAAAIAAIISMLTAGMFEYNFGDSEFLMLFLVLVTLPYAAEYRETGNRKQDSGFRIRDSGFRNRDSGAKVE